MSIPLRITLCPFPPLHWFRYAQGAVVLDLHEHYVKQSFRNRYSILGVNGPMILTIPVEGQKGNKVPLRDIRMTGGRWRQQHLGSIRAAYGRAAFFEHYFDDLTSVFHTPGNFLADFSIASLNWCKSCGIPVEWETSEDARPPRAEMIEAFEPSYLPPAFPSYSQVFTDRFGFISGLSVMDLLMNCGPRAVEWLEKYREIFPLSAEDGIALKP